MRGKLAAGNWKMNGTSADLGEVAALAAAHPAPRAAIVLCPPSTLIARMAEAARGTALAVGGQDCHASAAGAHTGDISAAMLVDAGASHVIVGHSERRADHGESDAMVRAKAEAALGAGLVAIVCVGETEAERDAGRTLEVIATQLDGALPAGAVPDDRPIAASLVIAYEPVWAIGTGRVPSGAEIAEVHGAIRARLAGRFGAEAAAAIRILYGGSVKPSNAAEIFATPDVDGALVGGAALRAADFSAIIAALEAA